jgi:hypothetical protein
MNILTALVNLFAFGSCNNLSQLDVHDGEDKAVQGT